MIVALRRRGVSAPLRAENPNHAKRRSVSLLGGGQPGVDRVSLRRPDRITNPPVARDSSAEDR